MLALYIHWPFCKSKCPYCDFNSHVSESIAYAKWEEAYKKECDYFASYLAGKEITSIFFGGGTPSLMPVSLIENILAHIAGHYNVASNCEITLEANPTSIEAQRFAGYKEAGINRVSMGIQALRDQELKFLGREHSSGEAKDAIAIARSVFDNYSFDLIYARPNQTVDDWQKELEEALEIAGPHMSLYQLTIEKGTPFFKRYEQHEFSIPNQEEAAELYEATHTLMASRGYENYEISNYAQPGFACKHNMSYWRYDDYLGIGPGAHSRITLDRKKTAIMMTHAPEKWLGLVNEKGQGIQQQFALDRAELLDELLIMGLRTKEGLALTKFVTLFGQPFERICNQENVKMLLGEGLIEIDEQRIIVTEKGKLLLNTVVAKLSE